MRIFCSLSVSFVLSAAPALAQDVLQPVQLPPVLAPDAMAQARSAALRHDPAEALSRYLRVLANRPDDQAALIGAGQAALAVGDVDAAAGFFGRADARDPRNGAVKQGLAEVLLQQGNARGALRQFHDAVDLGVPAAAIAADRGLAYDLRGDQRRAQADYQLALHGGASDEVTRRLALSQAIAGDRVTALATLDPLLRRQDVPAWRARAFVFAVTGDGADAIAAAGLVMPREQVAALAPYLPRLAVLRPADKAAAIHLGRFPGEAAVPATSAPVAIASSAPARAPLPPSGPSPVSLDPFGPAASSDTAADDRARDRALAQALAAARARAGPRTSLAVRPATPAPTVSQAPAVATRSASAPAPAVQLAEVAPRSPVAPVSPALPPAPPSVSIAPASGTSRAASPAAVAAIQPTSGASNPQTSSASPVATQPLASVPASAGPPVTLAQVASPISSAPAIDRTLAAPSALPSIAPAPPPSATAFAAPVRTGSAPAPARPPVDAPPPQPAGPTRAERLAQDKARRAEAAAKQKAAEEKQAAAEEKRAKLRDPARHWVQVAGGANKHDLGRAWDDLKKKWPKQLAGRSPWTTHYRFTNRLLIGPFPSSDAAQDWVGEHRKEGFATFRVETEAGDPVERVKS